MSRDVVSGRRQGRCVVVAVAWTSWLVRGEGEREVRDEVVEASATRDAGKPECT